MIDTIIFDAEGVILDTEPVWDKGQEEFLRRRGLVYKRERVKHMITGRSLQEGTNILISEYNLSGDPETLASERLNIVQELLETEIRFVPGFLEFFGRIKETYKTGIASSMNGKILEIADRMLNLSELFNGRIYTIAEVGYVSKPDPSVYLYAAEKLNSDPSSCVAIEDSPHGIEAAKRAGMKCIAITTTYDKLTLNGADFVVDSFAEIDLREFRLTSERAPSVKYSLNRETPKFGI
jgi:beta-phosphoglucomutase